MLCQWFISKETSYIVGNKKFYAKICILNLGVKRKNIFARVIIRYYGWKKIAEEMGKIIIKNAYRSNNQTKFRKWITRRKFVPFRSTIDTSKSRTRRIEFIIFILHWNIFCLNFRKKRCSEASRFKEGYSLRFSNSDVSETISWMPLS